MKTLTEEQSNTIDNERVEALMLHLDIEFKDREEITEESEENTFSAQGAEYMVLTDDEADEKASENIKETLWAFNAEFLASETGSHTKYLKLFRIMADAKAITMLLRI